MEWTLRCWILVKDASQVSDSVINLKKLHTEKPIQQNQRLLIENVPLKMFECTLKQRSSCCCLYATNSALQKKKRNLLMLKFCCELTWYLFLSSRWSLTCFPSGGLKKSKQLPLCEWLTVVQGDHLAPGVTGCHQRVKMLIWILITRSYRQGNYCPSPASTDSPHMAKSRGTPQNPGKWSWYGTRSQLLLGTSFLCDSAKRCAL